MPQTVAIIQARMGSTRLPGKVAMHIGDKPVLSHVIERCTKARKVDNVVVATTELPEDNQVVEIARENKVACYRGSEKDLLSRYYFAAKQYKAENIIRITADCPLLDPSIIDQVVLLREKKEVDYASNTLKRTYPRGVDVSVFTFDVLEKTYLMAKQPWEREHVTPFMKERTDLFTHANLAAPGKLFRPDLRITVDTEEDLMLIKAIYYFLGDRSLELDNIIALFDEQPWLAYINKHIKQKENTA